MKIRLLRHATMIICFNGMKILVDPMLSPAGSMPPIQNSADSRRNPLVEMPSDMGSLEEMDAVLLTHTHRDHFDDTAARLLPRDIPLICQPEDEVKLSGLDFSRVCPVGEGFSWGGINFTRTGGRHGTGDIGKMMAPVSGYYLEAEKEPSLYIAGDTIWCPEVERVLETFHPRVTVVYAGGASFKTGGPITMTADDVLAVLRKDTSTQVLAVHMEAINHCLLTREELRSAIENEGFGQRVLIPTDGQWVEF